MGPNCYVPKLNHCLIEKFGKWANGNCQRNLQLPRCSTLHGVKRPSPKYIEQKPNSDINQEP